MFQKFISVDEINGLEFDWYAVDLSGQYALFSTAGSGVIPECIVNFIDEYGDVAVPSAFQGKDPWKPLAKAGFFVFDMLGSNDYQKKVNADGLIKSKIEEQLESLPNLLQFNGYFEQISKVEDLSKFQLKTNHVKSNPIKYK